MSASVNYAGDPTSGSGRNPFSYQKIEEINRDSTTNWLTAEEITQHLNLFDDTSQDSYIMGLELATRQAIEDYLGMPIFAVSYRVWYGATSATNSPVALDLPEVSQGTNTCTTGVTINKVGYYNSNNVLTLLATSGYFYDASGNRVVVNNMPDTISYTMANPIIVEYTANNNPLAAYPVIKQAGLLLLTHLYNQRSNSADRVLHTIPYGVDMLLRKYKPLVL
jgi:hypothetical protein